MGRLLKPQRPPLRVPRRGLLPVLEQGAETPGRRGLAFLAIRPGRITRHRKQTRHALKTVCCHPRPSGTPGETLLRMGLQYVIGPSELRVGIMAHSPPFPGGAPGHQDEHLRKA